MKPPPMDRTVPATTETTVVALGCFWGVEAAFGALDGVVRTTVGFAGGQVSDPTYATIGDHTEAVRIEYAPARLRYAGLLDRFWTVFDPALTPAKRRYQPLLAPQNERQAQRARASRADAIGRDERAGRVEIVDGGEFSAAALRHQKHTLRRYEDVTGALRARLPSERAFARSPAAALAAGYVGGYRSPARLADDQARLGLPNDATATLRTATCRHGRWNAFVQAERAA
ncbi:peptide-methionine (S)-S-oxide reductase [Salinibacter altiplanensis]|uniref:peptide-methionine (S)-S-oxide reductase n=1 Tax=Salinibacter altiplanensis TaxID=1803181 RepID=UPI000C9FD850|nr:peptide-methionine (S)-S-oxide reductase [Salinibacter altiplanensis]